MNFWLAWIFSGGERDLFFSTASRLKFGYSQVYHAVHVRCSTFHSRRHFPSCVRSAFEQEQRGTRQKIQRRGTVGACMFPSSSSHNFRSDWLAASRSRWYFVRFASGRGFLTENCTKSDIILNIFYSPDSYLKKQTKQWINAKSTSNGYH